jgi:hypothetical protein
LTSPGLTPKATRGVKSSGCCFNGKGKYLLLRQSKGCFSEAEPEGLPKKEMKKVAAALDNRIKKLVAVPEFGKLIKAGKMG